MKMYLKEPVPCTSGYEPIMIFSRLMERRKEETKVGFDFFYNIQNPSKYTKTIFDKILELFGIREIGEWERSKWKEVTKGGYVYFARNGNESQIKIGWAVDPHSRLRALQTGNPNLLHLIGVISASDKSSERFFHSKFKKQRIKNEWFHYKGELKDFIETKGNMLLFEMPYTNENILSHLVV